MADVQAAFTLTAEPPEREVSVGAPAGGSGTSFSDILAELNPLQHIPLVGTLYRAVTGEQLSEPARLAGSLVFGGLTGGPIGVATSLASTLLQKLTGIDADAVGQRVLASIGIGHAVPSGADAAPVPSRAAAAVPLPDPTGAVQLAAATVPAGASPASQPWSAAQLAALGVTMAGTTLHRGALEGADALNSLELDRLRNIDTAVAAYNRQGAASVV